jgi:DNA-binding GntR family transcriptional regulator
LQAFETGRKRRLSSIRESIEPTIGRTTIGDGLPANKVTLPSGSEPLTQLVARNLRESIANGRLKPGMPIRQETIAREFGISRIPVREALRQLESEGLVIIRPNTGARVAILDFEECVEIYKIRERLEPLAFSESIGRHTHEELAGIVELARELETLTDNHDVWLAGDRRLHLACYGGVSGGPLVRMIVGFWNTTQHYRRLLLSTFTDEDFEIVRAEHELIVNALVTGNARAGEKLVRIAMERSRLRLARNRELFDK